VTRHPLTQRAPDPARAHGAWVYLGTSVLAGVMAIVIFGLAGPVLNAPISAPGS